MKTFAIMMALAVAWAFNFNARAQSPQDAPKEHSMTGCLQKGVETGTFRLTQLEKGPAVVEIAETTARLDPHVGHKIEITGTAMSGKDPKAHTMKVTAMKMISADCPAGGSAALAHPGHVAVSASDVKWGPAPATLPAGAQAALLEGNPAEAGPFTLRLKFPAHYKVLPHRHPAAERVTVLSGNISLGMGEQWDESKGQSFSTGSFAVLPANINHFAWTSQETVIQIHATGPWGMTYVNPADDPSKK